MVSIESVMVEQGDKIDSEHNGGFKYGHDYNILKAIVEHCSNGCLVRRLAKSLKDKAIRDKVALWITC